MYTLSDLSERMLDEARDNVSKAGLDFSYQIIDGESIPEDAESFDAVIANHMLCLLPNLTQELREIHRILKTDSRLYATTNGRDDLLELREFVRRVKPDAWEWKLPRFRFILENGADQLSRVLARRRAASS